MKKFNPSSLFVKLPLTIIITTTFTIILSSLVISANYEALYRQEMDEEALFILSSLEQPILSLLKENDYDSLQRLLDNTAAYNFIKTLRIYSEDGLVLASNMSSERGKRLEESTIESLRKRQLAEAKEVDFRQHIYKVAIPLNHESQPYLFLSVNIRYEKKIHDTYAGILLIQDLGALILIFLILLFFVYKFILRPLSLLSRAVREIIAGNINHRVELRGNDEFGRFAALYNSMLDEINNKNRLLESYSSDLKEKVEEKTASLREANQSLESAYRKLQKTQSKLLQADKMATIGSLAAGVAHEINNPISYIKSNMETLKSYKQELECFIDAAAAEYDLKPLMEYYRINPIREDLGTLLEETIEGTIHIQEIVKGLKGFSHIGGGKLDYKDINELLDSTLKVLRNEIKNRAEVIKDYGELPQIRCFPQLLNQAFLNIIINAIQALDGAGVLKIRTALKEKIGSAESFIKVEIEDNGRGIPMDSLVKIFDPFFTTKEVGQGTGLGLSIVYDIITQHRGTIDVVSKPGQGTIFTIELPLEPNIIE